MKYLIIKVVSQYVNQKDQYQFKDFKENIYNSKRFILDENIN